MGVVYRARHSHLGRTVALKLLPPEYVGNQAFRARFIRESQSAAALQHPNVVTVYDAGEADGVLFIAMQFIDGPDLATVLHRDGPLSPAYAMWMVEQIADALEAAHTRGLIHRDVKPANVLVDQERCYLTDFGLTRPVAVVTSVTAPGHFVGTVDYVAPEQIRGHGLDARTDVYGLGCMLYRCLAGDVPFPRETELAAIHAHLYDEPPRLSEARPDLPPALDEVIFTALAKDKEDRYAGANALAAAANHSLSRRGEAETAPTRALAPSATNDPALAAPERATGPTAHLNGRGRRMRVPLPLPGVAAAITAVGGLVVAGVIAFGGGDENKSPTTAATTRDAAAVKQPAPAPAPSTERALVADPPLHVASHPVALASGAGSIWVAGESGTVSTIDSERRFVRDGTIAVGGRAAAITVGTPGTWVVSRDQGMLTRIDSRTGGIVARIAVGKGASGVSIGTSVMAVWVTNEAAGTVVRIDPNTNTLSPPIRVGGHPRAIGTTATDVWVADRVRGTVTRIVAKTRRRGQVVRVGRRPAALAFALGKLWVANAGDGTVAQVDLKKRKLVGRLRVGGAPSAIVANRHHVFVADSKRNVVVELDPVTGKRQGRTIKVGREPVAMRFGSGSVWVANRRAGTVSRIEY